MRICLFSSKPYDRESFLAAGALLYQGPWVAERLVEFGEFLAAQPDSIHPVVRDILRSGHRYSAVDAFGALQRLQELKAVTSRLWRQMDVLVLPTIGTTFTVDEVLDTPAPPAEEVIAGLAAMMERALGPTQPVDLAPARALVDRMYAEGIAGLNAMLAQAEGGP